MTTDHHSIRHTPSMRGTVAKLEAARRRARAAAQAPRSPAPPTRPAPAKPIAAATRLQRAVRDWFASAPAGTPAPSVTRSEIADGLAIIRDAAGQQLGEFALQGGYSVVSYVHPGVMLARVRLSRYAVGCGHCGREHRERVTDYRPGTTFKCTSCGTRSERPEI